MAEKKVSKNIEQKKLTQAMPEAKKLEEKPPAAPAKAEKKDVTAKVVEKIAEKIITEPRKAEDLFSEFKEHSVAEFFTKNRQMLGYSGKIKSLTTVVHEYITNSLDACEEAGILPNIYISIKEAKEGALKVISEDNGPGIPRKHIGGVFGAMLSGTKFHRYIQQRGQQGIGAAGATMFSQITTGKPTIIVSSTGQGEAYKVYLMIDVKKNQPEIISEEIVPMNFRGVKIESEFKGVDYINSDQSPSEYVRRTALANPHAKIVFKAPDNTTVVYDRVMKELPKKAEAIKPHPLGLEANDLISFAHASKGRNLGTFLTGDLSRVSDQRLDEIKKLAKDVNFDMKPHELTWQDAEKLIRAFKQIKFLAPPTTGLSPIGGEQIRKALENILNPDFVDVLERPPALYRGGVPFIIEVGIAYGGQAGRQTEEGRKMEIMRFANRAPLLFDAGGCAINKAIDSIDWKRYEIKDPHNEPLTVFVNLVSVHIPYQSAGKQSISLEEEIVNEIRLAVMDCARRLKTFLHGKRRRHERQAKFDLFKRYIPEVAIALESLTGSKKEALVKRLAAMVEGRLGLEEGGEEAAAEEAGASSEPDSGGESDE